MWSWMNNDSAIALGKGLVGIVAVFGPLFAGFELAQVGLAYVVTEFGTEVKPWRYGLLTGFVLSILYVWYILRLQRTRVDLWMAEGLAVLETMNYPMEGDQDGE